MSVMRVSQIGARAPREGGQPCCEAASAGPSRWMVDATAVAAAEHWLGGKSPSGYEVPTELRAILLAGFKAGEWTEDEMFSSLDDTSMDDVITLWKAAVAGSEAEAKARVKPVWSVKFFRWLKDSLACDGDETSSKKDEV